MFCCGEEQKNTLPAEIVKDEAVKEEPPPPPEPEVKGPKFVFMIVGARGIRNTDWLPGLGKPDCYCEVKSGGQLIHTTRIINDSMVPRWAEEFNVDDLNDNENLEFKVYDKDVMGADYLGKVVLQPDAFAEKGCCQDFEMAEAGKNIKAYLGLKMKTRGQEEYPAGPPSSFEVEVEKGEEAKEYGLEIDSQDMKNLQIAQVDQGCFKAYNEKADPSVQVVISDFIVSVNGVEGSADMVKEFANPKVKVKLVRALNTAVLLENNDKKKKHGLKFPTKMKNDVLVVMEIGDGYIKEYNETCAREQRASEMVLPYDRIVSVRDEVGRASKLKSALESASGKFQIGIQRPCPPEAATKAVGGMFRFF